MKKFMLQNSLYFAFGFLHILYSVALEVSAQVLVDGKSYSTILSAQNAIKENSRVYLTKGFYSGLKISADNVEVIGTRNVIFDSPIEGKAAIIVDGDSVTIENVECYGIKVSDNNGACVRQQGKDLTLRGVYFHDSQQGILSSHGTGSLTIEFSHFENLGKAGRSHAIYSNNERLIVRDSTILNSVDQGHEIKSRAKSTIILNSIVGSIDSEDSRTIDISNGGTLKIDNSILLQGRNTRNRQLIGYALEGSSKERDNTVIISNSMFILERVGPDEILLAPKKLNVSMSIERNVIIGEQLIDMESYPDNRYFSSREEAGVKGGVPSLDTLAAALFIHIK